MWRGVGQMGWKLLSWVAKQLWVILKVFLVLLGAMMGPGYVPPPKARPTIVQKEDPKAQPTEKR